MQPKDDVATNLLSSIEQATDRFQSLGVGPDLFELVARLIRNGARRSGSNPVIHGQQQVSPNAIAPTVQHMPPAIPSPMYSSIPQPIPASTNSFAEALKKRSSQVQTPMQPIQVIQPVQQTQAQNMKINQLQRTNGVAQSHQFQNPPPDWLQPKVFTGSTKV